ncbi:MAG TPA: hypothetical protein VF093_02740 [Solirubrobacterales bacterium]
MRRLVLFCALAAAALAGGCGSTDSSTPVACLEGKGAYLRALEDAPGTVRLTGDTPISSCLAENQAGGALASVGTAMLAAATELNADARDDPGDVANVRLGYLLGAAQRGADATQGIHAELLRRLAAAARYSPDNRPLPATFLDAYQRGFDAGRSRG